MEKTEANFSIFWSAVLIFETIINIEGQSNVRRSSLYVALHYVSLSQWALPFDFV